MALSYCFLQAIKVKRGYSLTVIASISGTVNRIGLSDVVIDVAGIGYLVSLTTKTALEIKLGQAITLHTAHIIREDSQSLFGFDSEEELMAFNLLCSVSGVGPKSALSVIGTIGVEGLSRAVATADDGLFKAVSGIGPKTAKLIVLSLTGKLVTGAYSAASSSSQVANVTSALVGLGYQDKVVRKIVEDAAKALPDSTDQELLRFALSQLSNAKKIGKDD